MLYRLALATSAPPHDPRVEALMATVNRITGADDQGTEVDFDRSLTVLNIGIESFPTAVGLVQAVHAARLPVAWLHYIPVGEGR